MKKILFVLFLIILSINIYGQISPLQAYDTAGVKRFLRVDANGRVIISNTSSTVTGGATAVNQATQISRATADSLNFVAIKTLTDSTKALLNAVKLRLNYLKDGTQRAIPVNGSNSVIGVQTSPFYITPDYAKITVLDSLAAVGGARADSAVYNPNGRYALVYIAITARTGADTLTIKTKSAALRNIWGTNDFSLEDQLTRSPVTDNTTIIIAANTNRRFLISVARPEWILITRKTTNGVNRLNTIKVAFEGVNL